MKELSRWRDNEISEEIVELLGLKNAVDCLNGNKPGILVKKLGPQELRVLEFMCHGLTPTAIAKKMRISVKTVSTHRNRLVVKFKVKDSISLIRAALRSGIVDMKAWLGADL